MPSLLPPIGVCAIYFSGGKVRAFWVARSHAPPSKAIGANSEQGRSDTAPPLWLCDRVRMRGQHALRSTCRAGSQLSLRRLLLHPPHPPSHLLRKLQCRNKTGRSLLRSRRSPLPLPCCAPAIHTGGLHSRANGRSACGEHYRGMTN